MEDYKSIIENGFENVPTGVLEKNGYSELIEFLDNHKKDNWYEDKVYKMLRDLIDETEPYLGPGSVTRLENVTNEILNNI